MKKKQLIAFCAVIVIIFTACENPFFPAKRGGERKAEVPAVTLNVTPVNPYITGDKVTITANAEVNDGGRLSYQWFRNNRAGSEGGELIPDETGTSYAPSTDYEGNAYYFVQVTNTLNGTSAAAASDAAEITVYDIGTATAIRSVSVNVTAPVKGGYPAAAAATDGSGYTCTAVTWDPAHSPFLGGAAYTVTITLTAENNHTFIALRTAAINGQAADVMGNNRDTLTLSYTFAQTDTRTVSAIAIESQPSKLTYIHGDTLNLAGLAVTLTFDNAETENVALANFVSRNISTHPANGAALSYTDHDGQSVAVSYGELAANTNNLTVNKVVVTAVDVTITGPSKDSVPETTATTDGEGYTCGAVSWSPNDNPFKGSTRYTAAVTITADADYTFASTLTAAAINGDNATVTSNTGSTVTLSIQFDETLAKDVTHISIKTQPVKLSYTHGDTLDLTGLVVTLTFDDASSEDVPLANFGTNISAHPANGVVLHHSTNNNHPVIVSFGGLTADTDNLTVAKANPTVTWPTGLTAVYGQTLSNISLASYTNGGTGAFSWTSPGNSVGALGTQSHNMIFTPTDIVNYNTLTQNVSITVNAKPVTITATTPNRTLIPFDSADTQYGTTATFNVTVSGLIGSDTVTVNIASNSYGLSLSNNTGIGSAGRSVTITYNGTATVTQTTALSVGLTVTVNNNYTFSGSPTISPTVIDGQASSRAIPVTQANLTVFNTYARTTNGLTRHYKLTDNVQLTSPATGSNWTAIGDNNNQFTGSFNGQSYTITNLTIDATGNYQGMFGSIGSGGMVQNIGLVGGSLTKGSGYVGGVVGRNYGTVQNCYATTAAVRGDAYVGGIVGWNDSTGMVQNCYATGTVNNGQLTDGTGGVVGYNSNGTVQNCYATGNVGGVLSVGGVVGYNSSSGTVQNCYATGNVSSSGTGGGGTGLNVGGVVGMNNGTVQNCVALNSSVITGVITAKVGRVVGTDQNNTLVNNHARNNMVVRGGSTDKTINAGLTTTDGANVSGGTGAGQYNNQTFWSSTKGWDFTNDWQWNSTTNLPILRNMPGNPAQNHTVQ